MSPQRPTTVSSRANRKHLGSVAFGHLLQNLDILAWKEHVGSYLMSFEVPALLHSGPHISLGDRLGHCGTLSLFSTLAWTTNISCTWLSCAKIGMVLMHPILGLFGFFTLAQMGIASSTLCPSSEQHQVLLRLHIVIELLLNFEFYMNFNNGIIAKFAGYVNVTSTANGAWRLRTVLRDATSNLGYVPGYLAAPGAVVLGRSVAVHCPLFVADHIDSRHCTLFTASQCSSSAARRSTIQSLNAAKVGPYTLAWAL
jgi:hypothetical protein